jgi:hypothetical protein
VKAIHVFASRKKGVRENDAFMRKKAALHDESGYR